MELGLEMLGLEMALDQGMIRHKLWRSLRRRRASTARRFQRKLTARTGHCSHPGRTLGTFLSSPWPKSQMLRLLTQSWRSPPTEQGPKKECRLAQRSRPRLGILRNCRASPTRGSRTGGHLDRWYSKSRPWWGPLYPLVRCIVRYHMHRSLAKVHERRRYHVCTHPVPILTES